MRRIWYLVIGIVLLHCDSEDSSCRLSRYGSHGIFYDDHGRIYSVKLMDKGEVVENSYHKEFEYDEKGRVSKVREYFDTQLFQYFEVEYLNNQIIERTYVYSNDYGTTINSRMATFNLDKQGKIATIDRIDYSKNPDEMSHETYEYNDQGNVKKITLINDTHPDWNLVSEFKFDKKLNPFRLAKFEFRLGADDIISDKIQNKNNIVSLKLLYGAATEAPFVDLKYIYNERGYPSDFANNDTGIRIFEYECN